MLENMYIIAAQKKHGAFVQNANYIIFKYCETSMETENNCRLLVDSIAKEALNGEKKLVSGRTR